jgi:twitching motility protein PilT
MSAPMATPVAPEAPKAQAPEPPPPHPIVGRAPPAMGINLRTLLEEMVTLGASDLHIVAGECPKLRIDGEMTSARTGGLLGPKDTLQLAYSVLTENQKKRFEQEDELDFSFGIANLARFRGNCFRQRGCVSMVIRQIPFSIKTFQDLGLPASIAKMAEKPRGLVLVTGPTGSGKSTTLAAMIDKINRERKGHIITVEDPIEFLFEPGRCMIIQREIGSDTESFKDALVAAMRQDPDVIMVGEVRDAETAATCLKAAETGHLVISAIHTPDAVATIQRYIGMFESDSQAVIRERLGDALQAVISLRLLSAKNGAGRVPAVEIMRVTRTIREAIRTGRLNEVPEQIRKGRDLYSMQLFDQHLLDLVNAGAISVESAIYASSNPEEFERSMNIV